MSSIGALALALLLCRCSGDSARALAGVGTDPCSQVQCVPDGSTPAQPKPGEPSTFDASGAAEEAGSNGDGGSPGEDAEPPPPPPWTPPFVATTSAACGMARGVTQGETFTTAGGRTFHVWGPKNYDPNKTYPVLFTYHGWYATARGFQSWFKMDSYVGEDAFTVYPDAINTVWDLGGNSDLLFFDEMVAMLGQTFCIDPSHVYAFGFSFGGKFMNHLGCNRAGHVRAIAIGAGSGGGAMQGCGRLPVLFVHRTHDPDELISWARSAETVWSGTNACAPATALLNPEFNCTTRQGCMAPGSVTFCEDTDYDPTWQADWHHTVRENYRAFLWSYLKKQ
jgi:polyhydroxybutyrate depolymerase